MVHLQVLAVLVLANQLRDLGGGEVTRLGSLGASRKTNVQLSVLAGLVVDVLDPLVKVDAGGALGDAAGVVVELDEDLVELRLSHDRVHLEVCGIQRALGRCREDHVGLGIPDEASELVDHGNVGLLVAELGLNVEIETVDSHFAERTRALVATLLGSEDIKHLLAKAYASFLGRDGVVALGSHLTTNGEVDLLAKRLAHLDVRLDVVAFSKKLGRDLALAGLLLEDGGITVGTEVGSREAHTVLGGVVHEGEGDIVDAGGLAVLAKSVGFTAAEGGLSLRVMVSRLLSGIHEI